ncbi:MAG TPA: gamma-glutamylcyclotransferase family protein [Terracidiphilus sp.]|nr:gamma-glutamylcyclotransferase family protein [Terracidiphilus sp.]
MPFLFAYGTLQPGLVPSELVPLVARLSVVARGSIRGILYDLGGYPGAVIDPRAEGCIHGVVYRLPEDPDIFSELDSYEEFDPDAPAESLFRRILHPVATDGNSDLDCWLYVYNRDPGSATILKSGVFPGE